MIEERRIDEDSPGGPAVRKRVRILNDRTGRVEASFEERVRLYDAEEIDRLLEASGLRILGARMGAVDGTPWSWGAPRLVRLAERPAGRA